MKTKGKTPKAGLIARQISAANLAILDENA
jgi:hypothetical protein